MFIIIILLLCLLLLYKDRINILYCLVISILITYFILFPRMSIDSALIGLKLFINSVFPTIFPFLFLCNMLICYDGIELYSQLVGPIICTPLRLSRQCSLPLIISFLCGYPLGAKYSTDIYEKGFICEEEYYRLLNIASNVSPLFLLGSVATVMFNNSYVGYIMLIGSYSSCFIMSLLIKPIKSKTINIQNKKTIDMNIGNALKKSLEDATKTCIAVAGFIVIFSVITYAVKNSSIYQNIISLVTNNLKINKALIDSLLVGMMETTNGCYIISKSALTIETKVSVASYLCSFSGLSIIAQVHSFTYKHKGFKLGMYTYRKLIQGLISAGITYLSCWFLLQNSATISSSITISKNIYFVFMMILLCISFFVYLFGSLFNRS
ncbi:sporulation integral membrane protein YlbJ [Alloiococcus sp. CFN-8]|uniref:sporulation integral membrane protein YlbJ n=1 Tax=Alloiococcus sp. CFN-8 TaxID=3416081 RepID=UPI003CF02A0B